MLFRSIKMKRVCEKIPESSHNFLTDPLHLYTEGTHLRAKGTTLGADDGMGAAYMLDILSDEELEHPYLECCFTVQEEIGLYGAMALKPEYFKARRLINLDGAGEYRTYTTLAGSRNMTIEKKAWQICMGRTGRQADPYPGAGRDRPVHPVSDRFGGGHQLFQGRPFHPGILQGAGVRTEP